MHCDNEYVFSVETGFGRVERRCVFVVEAFLLCWWRKASILKQIIRIRITWIFISGH